MAASFQPMASSSLNIQESSPQSLCRVCGTGMRSFPAFIDGTVSTDFQFAKKSLAFEFCENCGQVQMSEASRLDVEKFYEESYQHLTDNEFIETVVAGVGVSQHSVEFFGRFIKNDSNKSFFDIGAGKGNYISAFHKTFPNLEYHGLEPSPSFDQLKEKSFIKKTYRAFFEAKNFKGQHFDYLTLNNVLEHVPEPTEFLKEIMQVMHDDSLFLIEVPNFETNRYDLITTDHLSKFTPANLTNLLRKVGLEIIDSHVSQAVFMKFLVKKAKTPNSGGFEEANISQHLEVSKKLILAAIDEISKLKNQRFAFYGQGIIMDLAVGLKSINKKDVACIVDDNQFYQGRKNQHDFPIVSFETFQKDYSDVQNIFMSMNECYHDRVCEKLGDGYRVFGKNLSNR